MCTLTGNTGTGSWTNGSGDTHTFRRESILLSQAVANKAYFRYVLSMPFGAFLATSFECTGTVYVSFFNTTLTFTFIQPTGNLEVPAGP